MALFYYDRVVYAHAGTRIGVAYTNKADEVDRCITFMEKWLQCEPEKIVGPNMEYTAEDASTQKAVVIQLCMGRACPVYHISAADEACPKLAQFLANPNISFAGVDIGNDIPRLYRCDGLGVENFVDIQQRWKPPSSKNQKDSLANYTAELIDIYYKDMKNKAIIGYDHRQWEAAPLPQKNLEYAVKDAYVTYEVYMRILVFEKGQENLLQFQLSEEMRKGQKASKTRIKRSKRKRKNKN